MATTPLPPLLYADSVSSADQRYFSQIEVHDPFIAFQAGRRRVSVQSALEFGRVKKAHVFSSVLPLEVWRAKAAARWPRRPIGAAEVIAELARAYRIRGFRVADDFPVALWLKLRDLGLRLECADGPLFPEREIKNAREAAAIREGNRVCSVGYAVAERMLRDAQIRGSRLVHGHEPLTSERLRFAIESAMMAEGGQGNGTTIVAGGDQACDPHERGSGPLHANELIIVDIFPRIVATGYYGDMTRTYLRGRASDAQRRLVQAVRDAQKAALGMIRSGVDGRAVHQGVVASFESAGFETRHTKSGSVGFFHGTGHGLGLAVHELPRMGGLASMPLRKGAVVTVEPGLYYPGLGGCRFEDVIQVTDRAPRLLSNHPYDWEICS